MDDDEPANLKFISKINEYYQNLLGYSVKETKLKSLNKNQWNSFYNEYNLNKNSSGVYLPRNQIAIIPKNDNLSLFHEYFGHGLYYEQSLEGKKLVDLEKKLLEEEKQEFQNKKFTLKDLQKFRKKNETFQKLKNLNKENLSKYELFAIWTEYLLSKKFYSFNEFEKKYNYLEKKEKEAILIFLKLTEIWQLFMNLVWREEQLLKELKNCWKRFIIKKQLKIQN